VSFELDGTTVSFASEGSSNQSANAINLLGALAGAGFSASEVGGVVTVDKSGNDDFQVTNYAGSMPVSSKLGGFSNAVVGSTVSLKVKSSSHSDMTVSFTKGVTATNDMDNLYASLAALGTGLTNEGYTFSKSTGDDTVIVTRSGGQLFSIDEIASDTTEVTFGDFANLNGGTVSFALDGQNISFSAAGTSDQNTNASNLTTQLSSAGFSAVQSGNEVVVKKTDNTAFTISSYADSIGAGVALGSFSNTVTGATVSLQITGDHSVIDVSFAKGVSATDDMNNLHSALTTAPLSATLASNGYTFSKDTSTDTVVISRSGDRSYSLDTLVNNQTQATIGSFSNVVGSTVSLSVDGNAISFTAAGSSDQGTNASRLQSAIDSLSGYTALVSGNDVVVTKTGTTGMDFTSYNAVGASSVKLGGIGATVEGAGGVFQSQSQ